ncbi:MAG: helix-turn-helix transcriptional regulator [Candidatus Hydrogenedentes bacterium]|nr:helix-turn-helix transcriptional regulator [Candidatus Hydrogenedentota bacterium]
MNPLSGDMLRGHLEGLVLATLEAGEAHGYEVMQRLNAEARGVFHMREGALYPVLYRLEQKGMLATRWEKDDAPRKGPKRRLYRLTAKGTRDLAARRTQWKLFVSTVGPMLEGAT